MKHMAMKDSKAKSIHGTDRMVRNVLTSWVMQIVFIVAGFVLPRLIDDNLGQVQLGIWDLCWSIVAYFKLLQIGIVSSINPFVAKFRSLGDDANVNISFNTVIVILLVMSIAVIALTLVTAYLLPTIYSEQLKQYSGEGQLVIVLLGISLAIEIVQSGFGGVLTGCHRWDILNGINAGIRLITMASMIICLILKGGLVELAAIEMAGEIIGLTIKPIAAKFVYRSLRLRFSMVQFKRAKEMMRFGIKTFVPGIGQLILNQTIRLMIVWHMGPAILAVFVRPASLIAQTTTFITKYAFVFTPTASSIFSEGDPGELRSLSIKACRYGAFLTLPLISTIAIFGGPILRLWMGAGYDHQLLMTTMAIGALPSLLLLPANSILRGMDAHGRPGIARFVASIFSVLLAGLCLAYITREIAAVALVAVLPLSLVEIFYVTKIFFQKVDLSLRRYIIESFRLPLFCCTPQLIIMLTIRFVFDDHGFLPMAAAFIISGIVTGGFYYRYAIPLNYKDKLKRKIRRLPIIRQKVFI